MKWFRKWRERREMNRLRNNFKEFRRTRPAWVGDDEADAFQFFCQLEALGSERVRQMILYGDSFDMTVH